MLRDKTHYGAHKFKFGAKDEGLNLSAQSSFNSKRINHRTYICMMCVSVIQFPLGRGCWYSGIEHWTRVSSLHLTISCVEQYYWEERPLPKVSARVSSISFICIYKTGSFSTYKSHGNLLSTVWHRML